MNNQNMTFFCWILFLFSFLVINPINAIVIDGNNPINDDNSEDGIPPIYIQEQTLLPQLMDDAERNDKKLLMVFDGTCVSSSCEARDKLDEILDLYSCITQSKRKIYTMDIDYYTYLTVISEGCLSNTSISYLDYCIKLIDYELILRTQQITSDSSDSSESISNNMCVSNNVYQYPLNTSYRWHLDQIDGNVDNYYTHLNIAANGEDNDDEVEIYILDTGIRSTHYEFSHIKSYTLLGSTSNIFTPTNGHGTHVAGIAVGYTTGITNHHLIDYPVCHEDGRCSIQDIDNALDVIITRVQTSSKRAVINMSFGTRSLPSSWFMDWFDSKLLQLKEAGAIIVVSAGGNETDACSVYPSASPYVITVGSHDSNYKMSSFSNYGSCVDIYAPGNSILSAWHDNDRSYKYLSGTSMASAIVTGYISDLLWLDNELTYNEINEIMKDSSNNVDVTSCLSELSCKAIISNCPNLVLSLSSTLTPTSQPTSKPTLKPTSKPTKRPTSRPTTLTPTNVPTSQPTVEPTECRVSGATCTHKNQCCSGVCFWYRRWGTCR